MSSSSRPARAELSPTGNVLVIATFIAAGWSGYVLGGLVTGFLSAVGVTSAFAAGWILFRARQADRTRVAAVPDVRNLPPTQALSVMGALVDGGAFRSELLTELQAIDERIEEDPRAAHEALEALAEKHPRSPAVRARIARTHLALDDAAAAAASVSHAIASALDGGMNPMAARLFVEFEALRDDVELSERHRTALTKTLRAHGHLEAAIACER